MPKSGPHRPRGKPLQRQEAKTFIKEWRVFRDMTVEELAEAADMSTGNISAIENQRQGYSAESLEKLAHALKTTKGALMAVNPLEPSTGKFWALWEQADSSHRETLTIVAERLIGPRKHE